MAARAVLSVFLTDSQRKSQSGLAKSAIPFMDFWQYGKFWILKFFLVRTVANYV